jgi:hypothetical protein
MGEFKKYSKYGWSAEETEMANQLQKMGHLLVKCYAQEAYIIYDDPTLEGAFTVSNEVLWTLNLADIESWVQANRIT